MWLIEFTEGHLNGVTIPIESRLILTGLKEPKQDNEIPLPEYLPATTRWEITVGEGKAVLLGANKSQKGIRLTPNRVYRFKGLNFFVYEQGKRNPKLQWFGFRQYRPLFAFMLMINLVVVAISIHFYGRLVESKLGNVIELIGSGYIYEGQLYVANEQTLKALPKSWQMISHFQDKGNYVPVSQFNIEVISALSGKPVKVEVRAAQGRDQILIETNEQELKIMKILGEQGIKFLKTGDSWLVSNLAKATELLEQHQLNVLLIALKSTTDNVEIIPPDKFNFSVFYSTKSKSYIYDKQKKYWQGSSVPNFGIIDKITRDKVVFHDGQHTREYLIQP
ncbi:hypothetical protein MCT03_06895 [Vibrio aestuarianus]|uniref:hypothetical protein n=1 Tax=Vibrio aestuarianus TaxID=28171 RepID=UPI0021C3F891|nr:hypothetical protein [Vibrio aestuarianus]MDE1211609.1 hypothetical protein [Vibrio aestuarianus]MDE1224035.1 hypothetical protein [Vibrio aestuarianus]MDE1240258.1 hypothetical protein [Vibrio aestuarianus]MDE1251477.1 hypothetical protein [Vibrio aestuarianus]MDE1254965.1 hypothetical protein [Vibrio aestuarianus]